MSEVPLVPVSSHEHTVCLLARIGQVAHRVAEDEFGSTGLRVRHYNVLQALADRGPQAQLAIGTSLRIDPATMVSTLDDLETAGLAERTRDPVDRRRYVVALTSTGRTLLATANVGLGRLDDRALADLTTTERTTLHRLLRKLAAGPALAEAFDAVRDQTGSRKMSRASSS